ncbi:MAG: polysaccharide biosynthesis/export family protein [Bacteroidetes bacterium]|nr:polysaccharide biosynthesis/export family protein [Bacteroidota bacterium]
MKERNSSKKNLSFIVIISIMIIFSSCTSQKKLIYLQEKANNLNNEYANKGLDYRLRPNDMLFVKVSSINPDKSDFFNTETNASNSYQFQNELGIYLNSFTISDSGTVNFPLVGNVYVKNLTVSDAQKEIQKTISKFIKDASVTVKLANYRVSILGDVKMPGVYYFYQDKVNILEAIAKAGDLTVYGNRARVMLIRKTEKGDKVSLINLTDRDLLLKEEYHILPNDIIYIEPNKTAKSMGFETFPWAVVLSTVSTIVTIYALLKK